jgi:hypothetical protein
MRKLVVVLALALPLGGGVVGAALADTDPGLEVIGPKTPAGRMRPWSPQYMNGSQTVTLSQAVATAKAFNVIVAVPKVYKGYVSAMKAANPNLQLFVYAKGMFTYDTSLPEAAYSHDASGNRIQGVHFPTWLLNPLSSQAVSAQVENAKQQLASSGYDGVFLDTLGPAALNPTFVKALPINPNTGQVWTVGDWVKASAGLAGKVAVALGKPVIGNGLRDGRNYFRPGAETSVLLETGMRGAMAEAWVRGASNPIDAYPKEETWKQNVEMLVDAGARGSSALAVTKVWTAGTQAQKNAWLNFTVATFLLGNDGRSYLAFTYSPGDSTNDYPLYHLDLGTASGAYAKLNNVYQRSFSGGRVLVNPTTSSFTVKLGATYHTLDGSAVTSITLGPNTAQILTT